MFSTKKSIADASILCFAPEGDHNKDSSQCRLRIHQVCHFLSLKQQYRFCVQRRIQDFTQGAARFWKGKIFSKKRKKGKFTIDRAKANKIVLIFALKNYLFIIRSDSNVLICFSSILYWCFWEKGKRNGLLSWFYTEVFLKKVEKYTYFFPFFVSFLLFKIVLKLFKKVI